MVRQPSSSDRHPYVRSFEFGGLEPIEALLAFEEIRQLKSRYFQAVDGKDWNAIAEIFTADAVVDFSGEARHHVGHHGVRADAIDPEQGRMTGGPATAHGIASAVSGLVTVHHGHDPQITLTGPDSARGRWSMYDCLQYADEVMEGWGHYDEEYRREHGRWRISRLTLTRSRVVWTPV
jgi:hypothetical protein